jgi:ferrous iron transport protein B
MSVIALQRGIQIDYKYLEEKLDTTMVPISALKKTGVFDLIQIMKQKSFRKNNYQHIYDHELEDCLKTLEKELTHKHKRYIAIKLLEEDQAYDEFHQNGSKQLVASMCNNYQRDMEQVIVDERYRYIEFIRDEAIKSNKEHMTMTDKLDRVFLNKYLAIPIFVFIMFSVYYLAAGPFGSMTVDFVDKYVSIFSDWVESSLDTLGASSWSRSLVVDGILAGVGAILTFLPQLAILFLLISFLETSGYMSRIAFFLDKVFQKVGLSGKSLIPFIIGSGCSVPAIMSARTIHDETEKKMTIMLTPFVPCSAKLPIITLFAGYFFGDYSGIVSASLYFFAVIVIITSAFIMKQLLFKGKTSSFILELPNYKMPHFGYMFKDVGEKVFAFIKQAGSIILLASIIVWFLLSFSFRFEYGVNPDRSMLAQLGNIFSWILYPFLGNLSWEATVSAIQGLVAKEQVVASMAIIAGYSEEVTDGIFIFNSQAFSFFTPASAYAFMVFNLFSAPCFGAIGAMRRELGTTKRMWKAVFFQTGIAWVLATIVYQFLHIFEVIL